MRNTRGSATHIGDRAEIKDSVGAGIQNGAAVVCVRPSAGTKYNMLNRLQALSRLLIRASLAVFTAVVLLLIQSAFWTNRVSAWMQAIILATALLSYFRPHYGLLALAALVPLGQVGSRTLDSQMRGAEALVLAFLAGALMRGW